MRIKNISDDKIVFEDREGISFSLSIDNAKDSIILTPLSFRHIEVSTMRGNEKRDLVFVAEHSCAVEIKTR